MGTLGIRTTFLFFAFFSPLSVSILHDPVTQTNTYRPCCFFRAHFAFPIDLRKKGHTYLRVSSISNICGTQISLACNKMPFIRKFHALISRSRVLPIFAFFSPGIANFYASTFNVSLAVEFLTSFCHSSNVFFLVQAFSV